MVTVVELPVALLKRDTAGPFGPLEHADYTKVRLLTVDHASVKLRFKAICGPS